MVGRARKGPKMLLWGCEEQQVAQRVSSNAQGILSTIGYLRGAGRSVFRNLKNLRWVLFYFMCSAGSSVNSRDPWCLSMGITVDTNSEKPGTPSRPHRNEFGRFRRMPHHKWARCPRVGYSGSQIWPRPPQPVLVPMCAPLDLRGIRLLTNNQYSCSHYRGTTTWKPKLS